jgi:hypothetical protein
LCVKYDDFNFHSYITLPLAELGDLMALNAGTCIRTVMDNKTSYLNPETGYCG